MALCFADANDLALDPATTAEDTQHILQSILSHTCSVFCSLSVLTSVLLPQSFYLSFLSFTFPSPLQFSYFFSLCYQRCNLCLFYPKHLLSLHLKPLIRSLPLSIIHSVYLNLCLSVFSFSLSSTHLSPFPLYLSPANSFIVLGSGWTMSAHMGPQCSPSREGREHQRTPITQCFNWAVG